MQKAVRKKAVDDSTIGFMAFRNNNEPENTNMNDICRWINQGKKAGDTHAWHNSTNIFIQTQSGTQTANIGDYILWKEDNNFYVETERIFTEYYQPL